MKRDDYQERTISLHSKDYDIHVHRKRTSTGDCSISIVIHYPDAKGGGLAEIEFNKHRYGDNYEVKARELISILEAACNDACLIAKEAA